jgi:hypothetical protein
VTESLNTGSDEPSENLADLLNQVRAFIRLYVVLGDAEAVAVTLWVAHTHAIDAAEATPYLDITSPRKRSGKSRLLEVFELLVARPWLTPRVTPAVLVRYLASAMPTLLLDESDAAFRGDREYAEALRAVLNAGWRRGGAASLLVRKGGDWQPQHFSVFGPKAIAGIGNLPDTVGDRSIPIKLKRRAPSEQVVRFRRREAQPLAEYLREGLAQWASTNMESLRNARPDFPAGLNDRAEEGWEPLLAFADAAGGDWPQQARRAAVVLSAGEERDDDDLAVRLLRDIQFVFQERATDRIFSEDLVAALNEMEEAPWGDLRGKPLDKRSLARLLHPYEIGPKEVRIKDDTRRGYRREFFHDAWARYIPPMLDIAPESETSETNET